MTWLLAARAFAKRVPWQVWVALAFALLLGAVYLKGRVDGKEACQQRQEAAEKRLDAKAANVAKRAQGEAQKAQRGIEKERVTNERIRTVIQRVACDPLPDGVRDDVQRKLEAARGRVPAD